MSGLDTSAPVGEWVAAYPETARVFDELQIDYCRGGQDALTNACGSNGLDAEMVITRLRDEINNQNDDSLEKWKDGSLDELCDHIEVTHHAFLRTELPRLTQLAEKVASAHGGHHPKLHELRIVIEKLRAELEPHMLKEERILFPSVRQLERSTSRPCFPFRTVANPILMMEYEHDNAGNALKRIRELTEDFHAPNDACNASRVLIDGLRILESDLHEHIHKENNILFPRSQQLEASRPLT